MKRILIFTAVAALLAVMAWAQNPAGQQGSAAPAQAQPSGKFDPSQISQIPAGTTIPAELDKSLDAKKRKAGDPVVAKVSQDLLSNGQVAIPRGTKITGHITEAKARDKGDSESSLGIAFDRMSIKDANEVPLQATIQAISKPMQTAFPSSGPMSDGSPGGAGPPGSTGGMGGPPRGNTAGSYPQGGGMPTTSEPTNASPTGPGALSPNSQGVIGMEGITLSPASDASQGTVIRSEGKNLKLDSGTQLILRVGGK
jgi:hypothetical protein